jgi:ubiquitin
MQIFIRGIEGGIMAIEVEVFSTIFQVKEYISSQEGISPWDLRIIFAGKELQNDRTLSDYGIQKESTFYIAVRLLG